MAILPPEALDDLENIERIRKELRLNDSVVTRYFRWVGDALQADRRQVLYHRQPVSDAIKDRIPVTLELAFLATFLAAVLAVPIGALCAYRENAFRPPVMSGITTTALSIPGFVAGIFFIWLFTLKFSYLRQGGTASATRASSPI